MKPARLLEVSQKGCREELERQAQILPVQENVAEVIKEAEMEAKLLMSRGADVGQSAAEAFVQWAKQEHELDNMTRSWEQAMEQEQRPSDSADSGLWIAD